MSCTTPGAPRSLELRTQSTLIAKLKHQAAGRSVEMFSRFKGVCVWRGLLCIGGVQDGMFAMPRGAASVRRRNSTLRKGCKVGPGSFRRVVTQVRSTLRWDLCVQPSSATLYHSEHNMQCDISASSAVFKLALFEAKTSRRRSSEGFKLAHGLIEMIGTTSLLPLRRSAWINGAERAGDARGIYLFRLIQVCHCSVLRLVPEERTESCRNRRGLAGLPTVPECRDDAG